MSASGIFHVNDQAMTDIVGNCLLTSAEKCVAQAGFRKCFLVFSFASESEVLKSRYRNAVTDFARLTGMFLNQPHNQVMVHRDVMVQEDQMVSLANLVTSVVGDFLVLPVPMVVKENVVCLDVRVMICHRK